MRIVSGLYGGRRLLVPKGRDIRPTSDKVRGAMFNILRGMDAVDGARVLDAFCGTGALGLEALSQGAEHVLFVDKARASLDLAKENADALQVRASCDFLLKDALRLPEKSDSQDPFDLIFVDPPYRNDLAANLLNQLSEKKWIRHGSICVLEVEKAFSSAFNTPFSMLQEKTYGDTKVIFLGHDMSAESAS